MNHNNAHDMQRKRKLVEDEGHYFPLRVAGGGFGSELHRSDADLIETPHKHDVLCGRGGYVNNHKGNVAFRRVVDYNKETYHTCKKQYKVLLSRSIVEAVQAQDPPGRFLQKDKKTGKWMDIGYDKAVLKASQALREGAENVRRHIHRATRVDVKKDATETMDSLSETVSKATKPPRSKESVAKETDSKGKGLHQKRLKPEPTIEPLTGLDSPPSTSPRGSSMRPLADIDDESVFSKGVFNNLEEEFHHGALMGRDDDSVGDGKRSFVPPNEEPVLDAYMGIPLPELKEGKPHPVLHVYTGVPLPSPPPSPKYRPATTAQTTPDFDEESSGDFCDEIKSVVSLDYFEKNQDELSLVSDEVLLQKLIIATHNARTLSPRDESTQEVWEL